MCSCFSWLHGVNMRVHFRLKVKLSISVVNSCECILILELLLCVCSCFTLTFDTVNECWALLQVTDALQRIITGCLYSIVCFYSDKDGKYGFPTNIHFSFFFALFLP